MPTLPTANWFDVSFKPERKEPIQFGSVNIVFPTVSYLWDTHTSDYPEHESGPIGIRITPVRIGAMPTFNVDQLGTFQGTYGRTGVVCSAVNAKVAISNQEVLVLEANSLDGATNPVSHSRG